MSDDEEVESIPEIELMPGFISYFFYPAFDVPRAGVVVCHRDRYGNFCTCTIAFDFPKMREHVGPERVLWKIITEEPLTIRPSILCKACGLHGHIDEGKWVVSEGEWPIP